VNKPDATDQRIYQTGRRRDDAGARVALIGAGTVGARTAAMLVDRPGVELVAALVRDVDKPRDFPGWRRLVTTDPTALEAADVLVEVAGGTGEAADLALRHLAAGRPLVTANKAALAERWAEFLPYVEAGLVHFEAAVMAGTPAIGVVAGALRGSAPQSLHAVLNGTCNVILSMMDDGAAYGAALAEAQRLGYAEAEPALDVEGVDAAHKLALLARLAFDPALEWPTVRANAKGITSLTQDVLAAEAARGRRVRLIGSVVPAGSAWRATVRPVSLPLGHPLVTSGGTNALLFSGDPVGEVYVRGAGAGAGSTASGVVADVLDAVAGVPGPRPLAARAVVPATPPGGLTAEVLEL